MSRAEAEPDVPADGYLSPGTPVDRTTCAREPIHTPGAVQPGGALLVAGRDDGVVLQASANVDALLGRSVDRVLGTTLDDVLGDGVVAELRRRAGSATPSLRPVPVTVAGRAFDAVAYSRDDRLLVVELEATDDRGRAALEVLQDHVGHAVAAMRDASSVAELLDGAARVVRELTGFDRVWAYRFEPDGHGVIVAEDRPDHLAPFLGLHYPAGDIPAQARALYLRTRLRHIPDATAEPVPLVPLTNPLTGEWPDLSDGTLRAVSPMHVQYLRNMGVAASMSIALSVEDRLWGLLSAHHYAGPWRVPHEVRASCELVGLICSLQIRSLEQIEAGAHRAGLADARAAVLDRVASAPTIAEGLAGPDLLGVCDAAGAAVRIGSELVLVGRTPDAAAVGRLLDELPATGDDGVLRLDSLSAVAPAHAALADTASGVLAVSLARAQGNYLVWFRPEWVHTITWGGAPGGAHGAGAAPLTPEGSFAQWAESVRATARPWRDVDVESVLALRAALGAFLLTRAEQLAELNAELARSNADLDAFAYIAAHDLKEPLRGIHNFATFLVDDYHDTLDDEGREQLGTILALARRMGGLLDSLLEYSRVGRAELDVREFGLDELVEEVRESLAGRLAHSRAELRSGPGGPRLRGDRDRVRQVLVDLVVNGIKYNEDPDPRVEISVGALSETRRGRELDTSGRDRPVVRVTDNGIGIGPEHWDTVFTVFRRLHGRDAYGGGTGAGLTIARRIVERHGGLLWVDESAPGSGTTLCFTLGGL